MSALDDPRLYERLDPSGMRGLIAALPDQAREAWTAGREWEIPPSFSRPARVVVVGVGGSAIGADVVATMAERTSAVPVQVHRGYAPPVCDEGTLVVACSFSGETEEALAAFQGTLGEPGMRLAIGTGGRLGEIAQRAGHPLFRYRWDGPPRTAFAFGLLPLLAILERLDAIPLERDDGERALDGLSAAAKEWGIDVPQRTNPAKQIAARIAGRLPVIIGAGFLDVAARRWAAAVNENAKQWAFHAALPEANHNLVAGLETPATARDQLCVLLLDSAALSDRNRERVRLTAGLLAAAGIGHQTVPVEGGRMLEVVLRACYLGDWVSLYLAMLNEVDPFTTAHIDALKAALANLE